jgi:hypothetical protein
MCDAMEFDQRSMCLGFGLVSASPCRFPTFAWDPAKSCRSCSCIITCRVRERTYNVGEGKGEESWRRAAPASTGAASAAGGVCGEGAPKGSSSFST